MEPLSDLDTVQIALQKLEGFRGSLVFTLDELQSALAGAEESIRRANKEREELRRERETLENDRIRFERECTFVSANNEQTHDTVSLLVSGKQFTTTRKTLCAFPDSMLAAMFSGRHQLNTDKEGRVVLDRDPKKFKFVLDYCKRSQEGLPPWFPNNETERVGLREEFDFFCLPWPHDTKWLVDGLLAQSEQKPTFVAGAVGVTCVDANEFFVVTGGTDRLVRVFDAEKVTQMHVLSGHTNHVFCVALCENRAVSGSRDRTVRMWDVLEGKPLTQISYDPPVWALGFSGSMVVCGTRNSPQLSVWEYTCTLTEQGESYVARELPPLGDVDTPSGRLSVRDSAIAIQTLYDKMVRVCDLGEKRQTWVYTGHTKRMDKLFLTQYSVVGASKTVDSWVEATVWDRLSGAIVQRRNVHTAVNPLSVSEHVLFYTDLSNRLVLLDVDKGLAVNLSWVAKFSNSSHGLAFNSKSLITVMADKTLLIWKGNQWSRRRHGKSEKVIMSAGVLHTRP